MSELSVLTQGGFLLVEFQGKPILNTFVAEETGRELLDLVTEGNGKDLVLDFSSVKLMTSAMINEFMKLQRFCDEKGNRLVFFNLSKDLLDILKACRLEKVFRIASTPDEVAKELAKRK